ncbi:S-adenosyl-L-methionine-dependent methyltransferase [Auricularia subglabra TFB-10046 SS5]|nr:S-adenosyl-L-methionine-dependent methyltransferase [Auricularia subglabra TFB-10046 SS5]
MATTFDAVVCSAAFHHFANPAKVTKLLASFLRPGGALHVVDVSRDSPEGGLAPTDYEDNDTPGTKVHHAGFAADEITRMFEAAGLTSVEVFDVGTFEVIPGTWTKSFLAKGIKPQELVGSGLR